MLFFKLLLPAFAATTIVSSITLHSTERRINRLQERLPLCDVPVMLMELPDDIGAKTNGYVIWINKNLTRDEIDFYLAHECGHVASFETGIPYLFGEPPFVSEYAKEYSEKEKNGHEEDYAESYAYYVLGYEMPEEKKLFFDRYLNE